MTVAEALKLLAGLATLSMLLGLPRLAGQAIGLSLLLLVRSALTLLTQLGRHAHGA